MELTIFSSAVQAEDHHKHVLKKSDYVGEEIREIKSLSERDIEQLNQGRGWGLAKVAELNGVPGPKHLLEMKKEISLNSDQVRKITKLFSNMQQKAIPLGKKLIKYERDLNLAFSKRTIDSKSLAKKLAHIANIRSDLRFVHLKSHLMSLPILSKKQLVQYNILRGYSSADPCKKIPNGHDPKMWRMHNNCGH
jgi:hypothetical protein